MRISDWSSDVCSSDLRGGRPRADAGDHRFAYPLRRAGDLGCVVRSFPRAGGDDRGDGQLRLHHRAVQARRSQADDGARSEEHTSELQSLMRISYAVFCLKKNIHHIEAPKPKYTYELQKINPINTRITIF